MATNPEDQMMTLTEFPLKRRPDTDLVRELMARVAVLELRCASLEKQVCALRALFNRDIWQLQLKVGELLRIINNAKEADDGISYGGHGCSTG